MTESLPVSIHRSPKAVRIVVTALAIALLVSCGGGGGGAAGGGSGGGGGGGTGGGAATGSISYSTTSVHFQVAAPYSATPPSQVITATVTGVSAGTLYLKVVENNPNIAGASNVTVTSATSGQATIVPAAPAPLLAGSHQGTLTVTACLNDPTCATGQLAGSPQTITVTYDIGSNVVGDTVTPRVVQSSLAGTIILRGHGFSSASSVSLGSTAIPASSITSYLDSQLTVSYPALAAGTYPISINSGSVSYSATLTVVDPVPFPASFLSYPASLTPTAVQSLEFDGQRNAFFVLLVTGTQPTLLRYAFDGSNWSSPTTVSIPGMQQVHLSPDGTKLLALIVAQSSQQASMMELDPVSLAQTANTPLPGTVATISATGISGAYFALANDGNAIMMINSAVVPGSALPGGDVPAGILFNTFSRAFSILPTDDAVSSLPPISSGDGGLVALGLVYDASSGTFYSAPPLGGTGTSSDLTGDRFAVPLPPPGTGTTPAVYDILVTATNPDSPIAILPTSQGAVINMTGTRLYVVEAASADPLPDLHVFDSSTTASPTTMFPEISPALSLAGDPGVGSSVTPLLAISTDSATVFVAGANGIAVQPVPQ